VCLFCVCLHVCVFLREISERVGERERGRERGREGGREREIFGQCFKLRDVASVSLLVFVLKATLWLSSLRLGACVHTVCVCVLSFNRLVAAGLHALRTRVILSFVCPVRERKSSSEGSESELLQGEKKKEKKKKKKKKGGAGKL
jgi:hypothetical protein